MHPSPIGNHTDPALGLMALDHQPQLLPHRPPPAPFHRGDHLDPLVSHQASPPLAALPTLAPASRAPASNLHQLRTQSATWGESSAYREAADRADARVRELRDGATHPGRGGSHGDVGEGPGTRRAGERHAGLPPERGRAGRRSPAVSQRNGTEEKAPLPVGQHVGLGLVRAFLEGRSPKPNQQDQPKPRAA